MKRFELNQLDIAKAYARKNNLYICLYITEGYIECRELDREAAYYIACDLLFDSKGNVIYNSLPRIDENIVEIYDKDKTMLSIVDDIIEKERNGYRIDNYIVHGNNESLQIEYTK